MVFQNQLHANKFVLKIDLENTQLTLQEIVNAIKKIEIQKQKQESLSYRNKKAPRSDIYLWELQNWLLDMRYECNWTSEM